MIFSNNWDDFQTWNIKESGFWWKTILENFAADHPLVSQAELEEINRGRSTSALLSAAKKHQKIPYLAILATPAIWGIWAAAIGDLMTLQVSLELLTKRN